jgi:hypothetical protein
LWGRPPGLRPTPSSACWRLYDADFVVPAARRGRPAQTGGLPTASRGSQKNRSVQADPFSRPVFSRPVFSRFLFSAPSFLSALQPAVSLRLRHSVGQPILAAAGFSAGALGTFSSIPGQNIWHV